MKRRVYTSESVTKGHPDKVCDQISDAILDACMRKDPFSRVACEVAISENVLCIMGQISSTANPDVKKIALDTIKEIGYKSYSDGFAADTANVIVSLSKQSEDISRGVNLSLEARKNKEKSDLIQNGAGDQGMMFGYATNETSEYMPYSIYFAHKLARKLDYVRENKILPYLGPDGKTQVTVEYVDGRPLRVDSIVIAVQHKENVELQRLKQDIIEYVIKQEINHDMIDDKTKYFINSTGRFVIGGPNADSGLTGRKIIVDTYGGISRHGGGAFSGKDCTKVDRSAAYFARYIAKNIVAAELADKCEVQLSYAIGVAEPVSVNVDTFSTGKLDEETIANIIVENFNLYPSSIIETLGLRNFIYKKTATYGHFGNPDFPWERLDMVDVLKKYLSRSK